MYHIRLSILLLLSVLGVAACSTADSPEKESVSSSAQTTNLAVYKSPTCGCCTGWVDHLHDSGVKTDIFNSNTVHEIKDRFGIAHQARSCHTAVYQDRFVFEGHVPPALVKKFMANPPKGAVGLIVPGMPIGSAGMEDGDRFQPYDVWLLDDQGNYSVYASVNSYDEQFDKPAK